MLRSLLLFKEGDVVTVEKTKKLKLPKYTSLTFDEIVRLLICVVFDVAEYALPILLMPIAGDVLDIAGIGLGLILFGWYGLISLFEFLPFFDFFPFFILTWVVWYYAKKYRQKQKLENLKQEWR